jgi:predicted nucleic acid-binding protein
VYPTWPSEAAIAACAIARDVTFWTLNPADFADVSSLRLTDRR